MVHTCNSEFISGRCSCQFTDCSWCSISIETLAIDAILTAVLTVRAPGNNEAAINQGLDRWEVLGATNVGIDSELTANLVIVGIIDLPVDSFRTVSGPAVVLPGNHVAAIAESCNLGVVLVIAGVAVDLELFTVRGAVGGIALSINSIIAAILAI